MLYKKYKIVPPERFSIKVNNNLKFSDWCKENGIKNIKFYRDTESRSHKSVYDSGTKGELRLSIDPSPTYLTREDYLVYTSEVIVVKAPKKTLYDRLKKWFEKFLTILMAPW